MKMLIAVSLCVLGLSSAHASDAPAPVEGVIIQIANGNGPQLATQPSAQDDGRQPTVMSQRSRYGKPKIWQGVYRTDSGSISAPGQNLPLAKLGGPTFSSPSSQR